jgi:PhzF family phenazine biosynthesis protein
MTTEPDKAQAASIAINLTELTVKPAVQLVSVFPAGPRGGNPAPIVIDAAGLSDGDMQAIARSYGHESGFVLPAPEGSDCDFLFRFWVPNHEMPMCGWARSGCSIEQERWRRILSQS